MTVIILRFTHDRAVPCVSKHIDTKNRARFTLALHRGLKMASPSPHLKEDTMKALTRTLIAASLAIGLSGAALANTAEPAQSGQRAEHAAKMAEHRAKRQARMAERRAERAAKLHDALKLSPQQEQAWASFQAAMQPRQRAQVDRQALRALPAPERMAQRIAFSKQRIAHMEARQAALASFYATLSADQQKTFDAATQRHGHRGFRGHRGHGMRQG